MKVISQSQIRLMASSATKRTQRSKTGEGYKISAQLQPKLAIAIALYRELAQNKDTHTIKADDYERKLKFLEPLLSSTTSEVNIKKMTQRDKTQALIDVWTNIQTQAKANNNHAYVDELKSRINELKAKL